MMALLERMDDLVKRVGLYPAPQPRPRHMRWLPLLVLATAVAGFALHVAGRRYSEILIMFAFFVSISFALFGPLRQPTAEMPLDERERLVRTRAGLAGAGTVAIAAMVGALIFSLGDHIPVWSPRTPDDWRAVGFTLITFFWTVPQLHASWTTRPIDEDPF